jgi:hypothetical protein
MHPFCSAASLLEGTTPFIRRRFGQFPSKAKDLLLLLPLLLFLLDRWIDINISSTSDRINSDEEPEKQKSGFCWVRNAS